MVSVVSVCVNRTEGGRLAGFDFCAYARRIVRLDIL